jgi:hypothetical protein
MLILLARGILFCCLKQIGSCTAEEEGANRNHARLDRFKVKQAIKALERACLLDLKYANVLSWHEQKVTAASTTYL